VSKSRPIEGVTLTYPATTAYKQWVWKKIRERGWVQQDLVNAMKKADKSLTTISTSTITDFLGPEDEIPVPSNSKLLPAINKVLGISPPPICDPTDELAQLVDKFRNRWSRATPRERALLTAFLANGDE
jgi:hypothetical protein